MTKTHFRIRGFYCKSPVPHDGPCPMKSTLFGKIRFYIARKVWLHG